MDPPKKKVFMGTAYVLNHGICGCPIFRQTHVGRKCLRKSSKIDGTKEQQRQERQTKKNIGTVKKMTPRIVCTKQLPSSNQTWLS